MKELKDWLDRQQNKEYELARMASVVVCSTATLRNWAKSKGYPKPDAEKEIRWYIKKHNKINKLDAMIRQELNGE